MNTDQRTIIKTMVYGNKDENGKFYGGMIRENEDYEGEFCKSNYPNKNREERKMMAKRKAMKKVGVIE